MFSAFIDRCQFWFSRLQERLWVRPLIMCILSVTGVGVANLADRINIGYSLPSVSQSSVESLLSVMASSMLTIAILAVGSMVAAYNSASNSATPRSFPLVIADDVSQNALSAFLGAFIFSLVGLLAVTNETFEPAGLFTMFALTLLVFVLVILTFVRWVDRIARLGGLGNTIAQVEAATEKSLLRRRLHPRFGGNPITADTQVQGIAIYSPHIGYLQHINMADLQALAISHNAQVYITALPGTFIYPRSPLAYVKGIQATDVAHFCAAFAIGRSRTYDEDPRFGLVVLAEIANKGVDSDSNDAGTAIEILNTLVRLFNHWVKPLNDHEKTAIRYDRVWVPELQITDMVDDAFTSIARNAAGKLEVMIRLQKSLAALAELDNPDLTRAVRAQAKLALSRAEHTMTQPEDIETLRRIT